MPGAGATAAPGASDAHDQSKGASDDTIDHMSGRCCRPRGIAERSGFFAGCAANGDPDEGRPDDAGHRIPDIQDRGQHGRQRRARAAARAAVTPIAGDVVQRQQLGRVAAAGGVYDLVHAQRCGRSPRPGAASAARPRGAAGDVRELLHAPRWPRSPATWCSVSSSATWCCRRRARADTCAAVTPIAGDVAAASAARPRGAAGDVRELVHARARSIAAAWCSGSSPAAWRCRRRARPCAAGVAGQESIRISGVMLRRFERRQRCCRWRGLGTIVRTVPIRLSPIATRDRRENPCTEDFGTRFSGCVR